MTTPVKEVKMFSPEDFGKVFCGIKQMEESAAIANKILNERLFAEGVKVWTHVKVGKPAYWGPRENGQFDDTHTGIVVNIQSIVREEKKVEITREDIARAWDIHCKNCMPFASSAKSISFMWLCKELGL